MATKNLPTTIYDKLAKGDPLSDTELEVGIEHFGALGKLLAVSGPVFQLATNEAYRVVDRLNSFQFARQNKW